MVWKGNFTVFESIGISETWEVTPTKIGVHACYINAYLHTKNNAVTLTIDLLKQHCLFLSSVLADIIYWIAARFINQSLSVGFYCNDNNNNLSFSCLMFIIVF